ncbi:hypothetical protein ACHAXR_003097 [Thalassiosira sp. AJA248-18]
MVDPIAPPRRGKFLSAPSSSPSSSSAPPPSSPGTKTRGKFLGKKTSASPSSSLQASSSTSDHADNNSSRANLRAHIHASKIAAISRRKAIAIERDRVMDDLEEAENVVLSLLDCASDLAVKLSDMTTAKSRKRHGEKIEGEEGNAEDSFEDLTQKVRSNGVGYLAGIKKLHKLLAPHATLVKSYKNHDDNDGETTSQGEKQKPPKSVSAAIPSATAGASASVEEATSNMYAARVKKRLALERSEILTEMIRLEELEEGSGDERTTGEEMGNDTIGSKRKHNSIEHQG